ncbi:Chromo Shadow Domain [Tyrophagus putrescentiae]|nr:Chromo Shadow Domain [Tyrophagus putrescentiae]
MKESTALHHFHYRSNRRVSSTPLPQFLNLDSSSTSSDTVGPLTEYGDDVWKAERIIDERVRKGNNGRKIVEFLIKWDGFDTSQATWEPKKNILNNELLKIWRNERLVEKKPKPSTTESSASKPSTSMPSTSMPSASNSSISKPSTSNPSTSSKSLSESPFKLSDVRRMKLVSVETDGLVVLFIELIPE